MTTTSSQPLVILETVSHRFGKFEALRGLSLTIRRGDIYGLLGLNGAGKTTTIRLILRLLRSQSGRIELFGRAQSSGWMETCDKIGATIEAPAFYPHLTGLANLELLKGLSRRPREGRSPRELLELTGLTEAGRVKVRKYSQGMTQRLYLAQALLSNPDFLVLDEPTSNLDPQGILDVRRLIQKLNREEGITVLLSSHQLSEVEDLCNRVAIINRGRKIVESTVAELFRSEECWIEIHADRPDDAFQYLQTVNWTKETTLNAGLIRTRAPRTRRGELNTLLVSRGFTISEFGERRPTLEDYFHQRIAEDAA